MPDDTLSKVEQATRELNQDDLRPKLRKLLAKSPMNESELADALNTTPARVREAIDQLTDSGVNLSRVSHDRYLLHNIVEHGGRLIIVPEDRGDGWTVFGFITDNHKCNKHHRQDVEDAAYKTFSAEGITTVFNAGNWIDGEARFNKHELTVFGMDRQLDHWAETTPQYKGMTTHFVSGDDHEGWYAQRECINIGSHAEDRAKKMGREDLKYIGHVEADVELKSPNGSAVMRVMHPGGGSAYAFSYAPQKIVEAFQGGEKPAVVLGGHYHKWDYCHPREVHLTIMHKSQILSLPQGSSSRSLCSWSCRGNAVRGMVPLTQGRTKSPKDMRNFDLYRCGQNGHTMCMHNLRGCRLLLRRLHAS